MSKVKTEETDVTSIAKTIATEEMVNQAKAKLDTELSKFQKYKFKIPYSEDTLKLMLEFFKHKVKWKFRNAYGVVECSNIIKKQLAEYSGDFYLNNLELEAFSFFLGQHEDVGLENAEIYLKLIDPLFESLQQAGKWKNKVEIYRQKFILFENSFKDQVNITDVDMKELQKQEESVDKIVDGRDG